jgi:hypothetical protein
LCSPLSPREKNWQKTLDEEAYIESAHNWKRNENCQGDFGWAGLLLPAAQPAVPAGYPTDCAASGGSTGFAWICGAPKPPPLAFPTAPGTPTRPRKIKKNRPLPLDEQYEKV